MTTNYNRLPHIGFGTYLLKGNTGIEAIKSAINNGYRLIDTAYNYENEGVVGAAIKASDVKREDIMVISKLPGRYHAYELAKDTVIESMYRLGVDYIDLYLIHWPNPLEDTYVEAWRALIDMKEAGYIKNIGVSNFLPEHIDRLYQETGVYPIMNQLEIHPYFNQEDIVEYHTSRHITLCAWSPMSRGTDIGEEPIIQDLARKYHKSPTQIILRWHIQRGIIPIPKSATSSRQIENISIFDFELTQDEMVAINQLSRADGRRKSQDPATYQEF